MSADQENEPLIQLKWYPSGSAYQLGTDRRQIRKSEALKTLHKWMMLHTDCGNITRQEAVSMVPPLALDVQPHHRCLDMCAAPGSKTSQLLEVVERSRGAPPEQQGVVVANDADTDRAYMLVHQCRRLNSAFLAITTHKGQEFPRIVDGQSGTATLAPRRNEGFFDRVLCDVPCSGDGTMRKSPHIWTKWGVNGGIVLHPLQLMIARRGVDLLKTGGLMVYSTCSMSPYEDEAVVAELLRAFRGTLELVDARAEFLPEFKCRPGLSTWLVLDDRATPLPLPSEGSMDATEGSGEVEGECEVKVEVEGECEVKVEGEGEVEGECEVEGEGEGPASLSASVRDKIAACEALGLLHFAVPEQVPEDQRRRLRSTIFPPSPEEREWMHLERCMRCVPHDEDTGGFFVATLRKLPPQGTKGAPAVEEKPEGEGEVCEEGGMEVEAGDAVCAEVTVDGQTDTDLVVEAEVEAAAEVHDDEGKGGDGEDGEGEGVPDGDGEEGVDGAGRGAGGHNGVEVEVEAKPARETPHRRGGKGLMDLSQWDEAAFAKVEAFYGLEGVTAESFFVREDYVDGKSSLRSKTVYYLPLAIRRVREGDVDQRLKVVSAGMKVFERSRVSGDCDYRLLQDGVRVMEPFVSADRKLSVSCQDFCNLLGGGLVSFSILSASCVQAAQGKRVGTLICTYDWRPSDAVGWTGSESKADEGSGSGRGRHRFMMICWRCTSRTLNVMCSKTDIQSMTHQLEALGVLRPKTVLPKSLPAAVAPEEASTTTTTTAAVVVVEVDGAPDMASLPLSAGYDDQIATTAVAVAAEEGGGDR